MAGRRSRPCSIFDLIKFYRNETRLFDADSAKLRVVESTRIMESLEHRFAGRISRPWSRSDFLSRLPSKPNGPWLRIRNGVSSSKSNVCEIINHFIFQMTARNPSRRNVKIARRFDSRRPSGVPSLRLHRSHCAVHHFKIDVSYGRKILADPLLHLRTVAHLLRRLPSSGEYNPRPIRFHLRS